MTNAKIIQAIRNEIERLKGQLIRGACAAQIVMETNCKDEAYNELLSFLSTLEEPVSVPLTALNVPAQDLSVPPASEELEEEIEKKYDQAKWGYVDGVGSVVMDKGQFIRIARHFAQWGAEHLKK